MPPPLSLKEQFIAKRSKRISGPSKPSIKEEFIARRSARSFGPQLPPGVTLPEQKSVEGRNDFLKNLGQFAVEQAPTIASTLPFLIPGLQPAAGAGILTRLGLFGARAASSGALSFGGAAVQNKLQTEFPEQLGDPRGIAEIAGEDIFANAAIGGVLGVPTAGKFVKNFAKVLSKPGTIRQSGAGLIGQIGEATFGDLGFRASPKILGEIVEGELGPRLLKTLKFRRREVKVAFEDLRQALPSQTLEVISKGKGVFLGKTSFETIKGPIALDMVQPQLNALKNIIKEIDEKALDQAIRADFLKASTLVNNLTTPKNIIGQGERFVAGHEEVKQLRTLIRENTFGKALNRGEALEAEVGNLLDQSIKESFNLMDPTGGLNTLRDIANLKTGELKKFDPGLINLIEGRETIGPRRVAGTLEGLVKESLNTLTGTRRLVEKLGGDKRLAREFWLSQSLTNRTNKEGILDLAGFVTEFNVSRQNKGIAALFSDKEAKAFVGFFREAEKQLPFAAGGKTGRALNIKDGLFSAFGTFAGFRSLFRGDVADAIANVAAGQGTKIALELNHEIFAKMILADPSKANIAKGLLTGNFKNKNVIAATKKLLAVKEIVVGVRVFNKGDEEGQLVFKNLPLNEHKFRAETDIFKRPGIL